MFANLGESTDCRGSSIQDIRVSNNPKKRRCLDYRFINNGQTLGDKGIFLTVTTLVVGEQPQTRHHGRKSDGGLQQCRITAMNSTYSPGWVWLKAFF